MRAAFRLTEVASLLAQSLLANCPKSNLNVSANITNELAPADGPMWGVEEKQLSEPFDTLETDKRSPFP